MSAKRARRLVEALSTLGIVALFSFLEAEFSVFTTVSAWLLGLVPNMASLLLPVFSAMWIGLCVYSLRARYELRAEMAAHREAQQNFELERLIDAATGLPNQLGMRYVFKDLIERTEYQPTTVIAIDIGSASNGSELFGGSAIDVAASAAADRIVALAGPEDFVARPAPGRIYLVLRDQDPDEHAHRVDRVLDDLSAGHSSDALLPGHPSRRPSWVAQLDIAPRAVSGLTLDDVFRRIDFTLHLARKHSGGGVARFDDKAEALLAERLLIERDLPHALELGQIEPYFHPLVDLARNRVNGFEVLARWRHPERGMIGPSAFIPIAEEMGLLGRLTLAILHRACSSAAFWPKHLRLSINLSPTDLRNEALMNQFLDTIRKAGMSPERIEVEITENAFVEEASAIAPMINRLKQCGVSISIDDFGTGYSSLHHLRVLPFDKIKIDQSFVREMTTNVDCHNIVAAVVALGRSLGLPTTAEGIEEAVDLNALRDLGCDIGQGYLFAKPMPAEEIPNFLERFITSAEQEAAANAAAAANADAA